MSYHADAGGAQLTHAKDAENDSKKLCALCALCVRQNKYRETKYPVKGWVFKIDFKNLHRKIPDDKTLLEKIETDF